MNVSFYDKYQNLYNLLNSMKKTLLDKNKHDNIIKCKNWLLKDYVKNGQRIRKREYPKISNSILSFDNLITHKIMKLNYNIKQFSGLFTLNLMGNFVINEISSLQILLKYALLTHTGIHQVIGRSDEINYNGPDVNGLPMNSAPVEKTLKSLKQLVLITSGLQNDSDYFKDVYTLAKKLLMPYFSKKNTKFHYNNEKFQHLLCRLDNNLLRNDILFETPYKNEMQKGFE